VLPDGRDGPGLFTYLRNLQGANGGDRRDVIATVIKGLQNRLQNGYLLRDVINKVNGINFSASEEMHTLSRLYETMLREMRDAAGDTSAGSSPADELPPGTTSWRPAFPQCSRLLASADASGITFRTKSKSTESG